MIVIAAVALGICRPSLPQPPLQTRFASPERGLRILSPLVQYCVQQWRKEPEMRIEDAYKWLFHATLGGEHAVTDDSGPRQWMDREWGTLSAPFKGEPEVVPLRPDGRIVRVQLRPYKARGGDKEMLLAVFVASAQRFSASRSVFVGEWDSLGDWLRGRSLGHLTRRTWERLDGEMRAEGYPAIHHSTEYEARRKPAYRVVLGEFWVR